MYISIMISSGVPGATESLADGLIPQREAGMRWSDPLAVLARASQLTGLAAVEAMRDGTLPMDAFDTVLGVRVLAAEHGRVTLGVTVGEWHLNVGAIAHGGFLSALMDATCGLAIHSTLPSGRACPHVQASYRFLRPALAGAALTCTGEVVHTSRTLAVARAELLDGERRVALGESTHALVEMPGSAAAARPGAPEPAGRR